MDDGELLVARRLEQREATQELGRLERKAKLIGGSPHELGGGDWLNSDRSLSWDDWRGRVVVVDIENARNLNADQTQILALYDSPQLSYLREKYADRGLVVIGIADGANNEQLRTALAESLKRYEITWPFKIESEDTSTTHYEFDYRYPRYVLVGRDGKVASIGSGRLPAEYEVKKLLEAP